MAVPSYADYFKPPDDVQENAPLGGTMSGMSLIPPDYIAQNQESLSSTNSGMVKQGAESAKKPHELWVNPLTGEAEWKGDTATIQQMLGAMKQNEEIKAGFFNQMLQENQQKIEQAKGHPLINALGTIASSLAVADPKMPGVVRGLALAAQRLNPSVQELQHERAGLVESASKGNMGEIRTMMGVLDQERKRQVEQDNVTRYWLQEARLTAQKGGGPMSKDDFAAGAYARGITDPARIDAAYKQHQAEAKINIAGQDKATERKITEAEAKGEIRKNVIEFSSDLAKDRATDLQNQRHENRLSEMKTRFDQSISPDKLAFDKEVATFKNQFSLELSKAKELGLLGKDKQPLINAAKTDLYLDKIDSFLARPELAGLTGNWLTYDPKTGEAKINEQMVLPRFAQSADFVKVKAQISHEIPRMLGIMFGQNGGGASLLRTDQGRKMIQSLGSGITDRPDQIAAVFKVVRDTNNDNKAAIVKAHKGAPWAEYSDLLGANSPGNMDYWERNLDAFGSEMPTKAPNAIINSKPTGQPKKYPWEK